MVYGGRGAGVVATVASGTTAIAVLPNTGGSESIVTLAGAVVAGLIVWGLTYSFGNR